MNSVASESREGTVINSIYKRSSGGIPRNIPDKWTIIAWGYTPALILSISSYSLWTDEAYSALLASQTSLANLGHSLLSGGSSDLQLSLYYLYLFLWAKLFGSSELAIRAT